MLKTNFIWCLVTIALSCTLSLLLQACKAESRLLLDLGGKVGPLVSELLGKRGYIVSLDLHRKVQLDQYPAGWKQVIQMWFIGAE